MKRGTVLLLWLVIAWVALWEDVSWANVLSGTFLGAALLVLFHPRPERVAGAFRPRAALYFLVYAVWKLVEASAIVAWEVVTPRNRINEAIVAVPVQGVSDALVTVVANVITLTPGTLTLEVDRDPPVLYVHVLHLRDVESVRHEVQHLELLAIRAFGNREAVRLATRALQMLHGDGDPLPGHGPNARRRSEEEKKEKGA